MTLPVIAVLSAHRHPRLRYVLSEAGRRLKGDFKLFTDEQKYLDASCQARIRYAISPDILRGETDELFIFAHPFLMGKEATETNLTVGWGSEGFRLQSSNGLEQSSEQSARVPAVAPSPLALQRKKQGKSPQYPAFFACPDGVHYDPFSMIFYCLSRYEEYQPFTADGHGRFPASASHALANEYLHFPLVDHLLAELRRELKLTYVDVEPFFRATYDVDVPFAYRLRGWRGIASGVKDIFTGHFRRAAARFTTLLSGKNDPYDVFSELKELHSDLKDRPRVFFLLAQERSTYDPNPSPLAPAYQKLIRETAEWADIGIHPSYYAAERPELIQREKDTLREITNLPITHSRQHFLRFALPGTYRELIRAGITHDHSMGYASEIGWRAGSNQPFYWYDLEREEKTHLLIHPFGAMEVTLLRYKDFATLKSKEEINKLYQNLPPLGGPLTLLWHNSSFAADFGWQGWWEMYVSILKEKNPIRNNTVQPSL